MQYCLSEVNKQLQEVSAIRIIFVERLLFDNEVKESLNKMAKHSGIKIKYYNGYILRFDKSNIHSITPHRIVFVKNEYNLLILYYDEYHETDELFFVDGEKYTLQGIKRYVRNYFLSKASNKPTKDSTKNNTKRPKIGL